MTHDYDPIEFQDYRPVMPDHAATHRRLSQNDPLTDETLKRDAWSLDIRISEHPGRPGHSERILAAEAAIEPAQAGKIAAEEKLKQTRIAFQEAHKSLEAAQKAVGDAHVQMKRAQEAAKDASYRAATARNKYETLVSTPVNPSEYHELTRKLEKIKAELKARGYTGTELDYANGMSE